MIYLTGGKYPVLATPQDVERIEQANKSKVRREGIWIGLAIGAPLWTWGAWMLFHYAGKCAP